MNKAGDENRSVRFTKQRIRMAVLELMRKKPYLSITVGELAERANISRSTFYTHYHDVPELVEQIEQQLIDQISALMDTITVEGYVEGEHPIMTQIFSVMTENGAVFRVLLSENGDIRFLNRLIGILVDAAAAKWGGNVRSPENFSIAMPFFVGGMINAFLENYNAPQPMSPERLGYVVGEYLAFTREIV